MWHPSPWWRVELKGLTRPFQPTLSCDSLNCFIYINIYNFCTSLVKGKEIFQLINPEQRWLPEKLQKPLTLWECAWSWKGTRTPLTLQKTLTLGLWALQADPSEPDTSIKLEILRRQPKILNKFYFILKYMF